MAAAGCGGGGRAIQIKGSDTMVNLAQSWAEEFMKVHPDMTIAVTGGGSGTGIASLINKTTDIAECSRSMEPKEINLAKKNNVNPHEAAVAYDGIAIVVSQGNPINKLSIKQLSDIFSGKINNWKDLGGENQKVVALSRDRNSGTHVFFLEQVVKLGKKKNPEEFAKDVLMMPSSQAIVEEVAGNSAAIGYIGLGYISKRLKTISIAKTGSYVYPTIKTVANHTYPISRPMYLYTNGAPEGGIKTFVDFVLSREGQKIVKEMDFVPINY